MISNQILQNTIEGIKGITKIELYVMDTDGNVLARFCRAISFLRFMTRASLNIL